MKKDIKYTKRSLIKKIVYPLLVTFALTFSTHAMAQFDAPNPPDGSHGQSGDQTAGSGSAPIGNGVIIMLGLVATYGGHKLYTIRKEDLEKKYLED